jgi:translation initiation factor eIF-2B subunit epsilon
MTDDVSERVQLSAVLIADSFMSTMWPITNDLPPVLMPLCNIPLIDYTIELLALNRIKELIIICTVSTQKVREHLSKLKLKRMKVKCISLSNCHSVGSVLRELDRKNLIRGEFVLISGDVVGNLRIDEAVAAHIARRQNNKDYILTKLFKELPINHRLRSEDDQSLVVLDGEQILQYDDLSKDNRAELNKNTIFKGPKSYELRYDLIDCHIDICSPELLHYFTDNFDYHDLRDHLMKDLLTSELYTDKFAAYIVPSNEYVIQVKNPRLYDAVSKDLMNRWMYPIVISSNLFSPSYETSYFFSRNNIYKENNVYIALKSTVEAPSVIGSGTVIGENCRISHCVIGRNCRIEANCTLQGAYLWEDVVIGEGCWINQAIISSETLIKSGCKIYNGTIISTGVVLNEGQIIEKYTRLYKSDEQTELGYASIFDPHSVEELKERYKNPMTYIGESIGGDRHWLEITDLSESSEEESSGSEESMVEPIIIEKFVSKESKRYLDFVEEVKAYTIEAIEKDEDIDNLQLEINSLKFAHNKGFKDCISGIVKGLVQTSPAKPEAHFRKWLDILERYINTDAERLHTIKELETTISDSALKKSFHVIVKVLFENDVIDDDTILEWEAETTNSEMKGLVMYS